jgi:hypothetical protein
MLHSAGSIRILSKVLYHGFYRLRSGLAAVGPVLRHTLAWLSDWHRSETGGATAADGAQVDAPRHQLTLSQLYFQRAAMYSAVLALQNGDKDLRR